MAALCRSLCQRPRCSSSSSLPMSISSLKVCNPIANRARAHTGIPTKFSDHITQVRAISTIRLIKMSPIFLNQNNAFRCYCEPIFFPESKEQYFGDDEIGNTLIEMFSAGFALCSKDSCLPAGKRLLCLQVVIDAEPGDIRQVIKGHPKCKEVEKPVLNYPTYHLPIEGAAGILLGHWRFWMHGYSILLDQSSDLHNKLHSSDFQGIRQAKCNEGEAIHTEVTLFVVVDDDCETEHNQITGREQLKKFLSDLKKKYTADVHLTYSEVRLVATKGKKEDYSHIVLEARKKNEIYI